MTPNSPPDLVDLAERLVRKRGLDALTMDSLAEAAGVSRATVYRQVGSREALVQALATRGVDIGERAEVRERVLAAAAELFPRLGLEAATVEGIAEAAGVGPATVYRHFGDKKGLILAFLAAQSPRRAVWARVREPSGDLRIDLQSLAQTVLEHMKNNGAMFRLALMERARGGELMTELARSPDRTVHAFTSLFTHYATRGELLRADLRGEPRALARAFLGILSSFGLFGPLWGMSGDCEPARDAGFAVDLFLRGAAGNPPAAASHLPHSGRKS